jgi:adenylate kinase family enzyme
MELSESRTEKVPVQLPGGTIIKVEVEQTGREKVSFDVKPFKQVTDALEEITEALSETLQKAKPDKASVKFGLELACVYLDESFESRDELYFYGYPDFIEAASVTVECEGTAREKQQSLIKFKAGLVQKGYSGSPLLNQRTGKVCGIVNETFSSVNNLGGLAVPTSTILSQFLELVELQREFHRRDKRWKKLLPLPAPPIPTSLSQQEYRNRQALLNKVKKDWVEGVLERSLYQQVLIELGLEEYPEGVTNNWNRIAPDATPKPLPQGTKIVDIFDEMGQGRTLLILGEPGSGKTTALLELARDLIERAEDDPYQLIPVVFNLSSFGSWIDENKKKRGKKEGEIILQKWLVDELHDKYKIPKNLCQDFVKKDELLLLLDGLDEVKPEYREQCLEALNEFERESNSEIVVCSRIKDYESLSNRLGFQKAIYLKLLTKRQINRYLDRLGSDWMGLKTLLKKKEPELDLRREAIICFLCSQQVSLYLWFISFLYQDSPLQINLSKIFKQILYFYWAYLWNYWYYNFTIRRSN